MLYKLTPCSILCPSLQRYQHKCDELEVRQKDFSTNYNNVVREKRDIVLYLKRTLSQKEDELADMLEKLEELQAAKDAEKESFERKLSMLRSECQETKDNLTSENMVLGTVIQATTQLDAPVFDLFKLYEKNISDASQTWYPA